MNMAVYLYRWKIRPGHERRFEENWTIVTEAMRDQCGSYGSRLHLAENGEYVAYAQWPDLQSRRRCDLDPVASRARQNMRDAIEHSYPEQPLAARADFLSPAGAP